MSDSIRRYFIEGARYSEEQLAQARIPHDADLSQADVDSDETAAQFAASLDVLKSLFVGKRAMLAVSKDASGKTWYTFNYVGIISLGNYLYAILPKYYTDDDDDKNDGNPETNNLIGESERAAKLFPSIMSSIRTFNAKPTDKTKQQDKVTIAPENRNVTVEQGRLELFRFLLEDYATYGPYDHTRPIREYNGEGEIDWVRTVSQITPVMSRNRPAYVELVTRRRTWETANLIARIQEAAIESISAIIEETRLNEVLRLPLFNRPVPSLDDLGGTDFAIQAVRKELNVQFETRRKLMLQNLLHYLENHSAAQTNKVYDVEGTGSFNLVWEHICQTVFKDKGHKNIPKPQWEYQPGNLWENVDGKQPDVLIKSPKLATPDKIDADDSQSLEDAEANTLIPDVVAQAESKWYILDAKYYKPQYGKKSVSKVPSVSDVIKQYFYEMAIDKQNAADGSTINVHGNAFIMPAQVALASDASLNDKPLLIRRGTISLNFPLLNARDLHPIQVFEMNPERAMEIYLGRQENNPQEILPSMFPENGEENA